MSGRVGIVALLLSVVVVLGACGADAASSAATSGDGAGSSSATTGAAASEAAAASGAASPTADGTAAPNAAPTPFATDGPWKAFTSARYRYSVKYPPGWIVTKGSSKLADQIDDDSAHYVFLSRDTVSGVASISLTVTHDIAYMKSHYKAKVVSNQRVTVNGWPGRLVIVNGTDGGRKLYIQHLIIAKGKVGYIVEMFSDQGAAAADKTLFRQIYRTFRPRS